jgi:pseudouridine synthase
VEQTYIVLNKPAGYVTTMRDPQGRPRVIDLLPRNAPRVYPVGRLDFGTTGLLLLTDDGDLVWRLLHPSRGVWKTYQAKVVGTPDSGILDRLRRGVVLEDGPTAPARAKILRVEDGYATLEIELHEGRKRQVRRMLAAVGHHAVELRRTGFGPLRLGDLPEGACRCLTGDEVAALRKAAYGSDY